MSEPRFVHLHVHSHFSLLDGCIREDALVARAAAFGMPALALTDHGNIFGAIQFFQKARRQGIKPIIGFEAYVAKGSRLKKGGPNGENPIHHLTVLARNERGYRNLIKLSSKGYVEGFYRKPRIDDELLAEHADGLVVLSGCMSGAIPNALQSGKEKEAERIACRYRDMFGGENFFLEVMRNGVKRQQEINEGVVRIARRTGIPLAATNDVHYLEQADRQVHEVVLCINTGQTLRDPKRMRMETDQFYFRSAEEMARLFEDLPEALENTLRIAERCDLDLRFDEYHLPEFTPPTGETPEAYLRKLCYEGARRRFEEITPEIKERLEHELGVIVSMGFATYFLIVWDFIRFAKENEIPVGPGRGSAAGSLVAYCLGITEVNPLRYDLLFERFLNSSRISMPDIDIDFCRDGRERVIHYVQEKYGHENVCQIVTFGTMAARAALRDAGRVLGIDLKTVDRLAKKIPGTSLAEALEADADLREEYEQDPAIRELFDISMKIEGLNRHASTHAAGVVITDRPLTEYVPLCRVQNEINTQYTMGDLEKIGLLKMDFLGLNTLTILDKATRLIRKHHGVELDLNRIPLDDPKTFELLQSGKTSGIFQLESEGMSNLLVRLKPDNFEDIIALLALYRPGPLQSGMTESYVHRKHGRERVEYLDRSIEEVLKETYGVVVYQEQVMRIANILAGFSLNDADGLRKAMGKKIHHVMDKYRSMFVEGAVKKGVEREKADSIYAKIEKFASYGFNKSHSTAYGLITFQTAFLKANYPRPYMAALMTCEASDTDKIDEYRRECVRMGIEVRGPDINESDHDFTVEEKAIRFGLTAIKGMGDKAIEEILAARKRAGPFRSLPDLLLEVDLRVVNKAALETLIKAGAFDGTGATRAACHGALDGLLRWAQRAQADRRSGQRGLFGSGKGGGQVEAFRLPDLPEWDEETLLAHEKEALGFILSVDPLSRYDHLLSQVAPVTAAAAREMKEGDRVTVGGLVAGLRIRLPKTGKNAGKKMALFKIRTLAGTLAAVAFPKVYALAADRVQEDRLALFTGVLESGRNDAGMTLKVMEVQTLDEVLRARSSMVVVRLGDVGAVTERRIAEIKTAAETFPGKAKLLLHLEGRGREGYTVQAGDRYRVDPCEALITALEEIAGPGTVTPR